MIDFDGYPLTDCSTSDSSSCLVTKIRNHFALRHMNHKELFFMTLSASFRRQSISSSSIWAVWSVFVMRSPKSLQLIVQNQSKHVTISLSFMSSLQATVDLMANMKRAFTTVNKINKIEFGTVISH